MVDYQPIDATYGALSHPVRRAILERLRDGRARVTEVARPFDMSLNAVSKHVRQLELAGLVRRTVVGRDHWLSLETRPLAPAAAWLEPYRRLWEERLDALDGLLSEEADA